MENIVNSYTERVRSAHQARMRFVAVLVALAIIVTSGVFWQLHYTGIAMANETYCGYEEHEHDASCYETILACGKAESISIVGHTHDESCYSTIETLVCGLEEDETHTHSEECYVTEEILTCGLEERESVEGHIHDESCYETVLVCEKEEHVHTVACMNNEEADVETAEIWEKTLPDKLTGNWAEDVVAIAESQLGYTESESNFYYDEETETQRGYTRYGAWYGNDYGDWDAMFASFCLYYAGVPEESFPESAGVSTWIANLRNMEATDLTGETHLYAAVENEAYTPQPGDIVFLDSLNIDNYFDGVADRVDIVTGIETVIDAETGYEIEMLQVIEGNYDDAVTATEYALDDVQIIGYGILPVAPAEPEIFEISYEIDMPDVISVEGPETIEEGEAITFSVSVLTESGYEIEEVAANGDELLADEISTEGDIITYDYVIDDITEDMIVTFAAAQVINGSGELTVYDTANDTAQYTLIVTDVPTNTKITLDSPHVKLVTNEDKNVYPDDTLLSQVIFYQANDDDLISIAYLMIDDGPDENGNYTVTPYDSDDKVLNLTAGKLVITSSSIRTAFLNVYSIQEDLLCEKTQDFSLGDVNDDQEPENHNYGTYSESLYTFKFLSSTSQKHTIVGYDNETRFLTSITGSEKFYYGTRVPNTDDPSDAEKLHTDAYPCDTVQIVTVNNESVILPLNKDGNPVYAIDENGTEIYVDDGQLMTEDGEYSSEITSNVTVYMVRDTLYTFAVETQEMVNEHTEDNGDVYLWTGTEYYVDQYHNMGTTSGSYTNTLSTTSNCVGVWVQLGRARETVINGLIQDNTSSTDAFARYSDIVLDSNNKGDNGTAKFKSSSSNSNYTTESVDTSYTNDSDETKYKTLSTSYKYGIAGPYYATSDELELGENNTAQTAPETTTTYVTGHIGDEFVTNEVWTNKTVYLIDDTQEKGEELEDAEGNIDYGKHRSDWIDLGAHASDGGGRSWWYWINDYYVLNNYRNQVEYLSIVEVENEDTGETEIHLTVDELGYVDTYAGEDTEDVDGNHPAKDTSDSVGKGKILDLFDDEIIIATKRNSVIKQNMMDSEKQSQYTEEGITFSTVRGKPHHIQLRMFLSCEIVQNTKHYEGNLTVISGETEDKTYFVDTAGNTIDADGTIITLNSSYTGGGTLLTKNEDGNYEKDTGSKNQGETGEETPYLCYAPYLEYSLDQNIVVKSDGSSTVESSRIEKSSYIHMDNEQEATALNFTSNDGNTDYYIDNTATTNSSELAMFDPESVTITVRLFFTGKLECQDGDDSIEYTEEQPYCCDETMTSTQLKEAYDTCPNFAGYDVAIHPSDSLKASNGYGDQLTLYKIWQDDQNRYGTRDGIDYVGVTLERTEADNDNWETVLYDYTDAAENMSTTEDAPGSMILSPYEFEYDATTGEWEQTDKRIIEKGNDGEAVFLIPKSEDDTADTWSMLVTSNNIPMAYTASGSRVTETKYYQYRIAGEVGTASASGIYVGYRLGEDENSRTTYVNQISTDNVVISGEKIWLNENGNAITDSSGYNMPDEITIGLYQDEKFYTLITVTADDNWKFAFTAPKSDYYGKTYDYQLYELDGDGNRVENGHTILLNEDWYEVNVEIETDDDGTTTYTVTNQYVGKAELPSLGGEGTWYLVLTGVLLMSGAGALLYRKKNGVIVRQ